MELTNVEAGERDRGVGGCLFHLKLFHIQKGEWGRAAVHFTRRDNEIKRKYW